MFDGRRKFDICVVPSRKRFGMGLLYIEEAMIKREMTG